MSFLDDEQRSDDESSLKIGNVVLSSSFLFIIGQLKVSQGHVAIMLGLCQVYQSHVRVCRGLSGYVRVHPGLSSSSVRVCFGPSGSLSFCQCPLWSVRVHLGQVRVMQGSCQNCVAFLVVFEAETGFSVLFYRNFIKIEILSTRLCNIFYVHYL